MPVSTRKAAVVGASGFLGSALTACLESQGTPVTTFTRKAPALRGDGSPRSGLVDADTIFWMASSINPLIAEVDPGRVQDDLSMLQSTLAALRRADSSARFVLLSSGGTVYDPEFPPPYAEHSPVAPRGAYGQAKRELEDLVLSAREGSTVVRVANAYGAGQPLAPGQGVLGHWLRALRAGNPIQVFGSLRTARDYLHVRDVTDGPVAIHHRPRLPAVLNLGSGRATTLGELLEVLRTAVGSFEMEQLPARGFDVGRTWLDIDLARRELDWAPQVELVHGVTEMWRWVREDPSR